MLKQSLHHSYKLLLQLNEQKILVHGRRKNGNGSSGLNIPQQMVEGRRITDGETLKIVTMVYAGYINKNIVARLQANHCNAMGLCGADGDSILAHKRNHPVLDYGFVGDIDKINSPCLKISLIRILPLYLLRSRMISKDSY